MDNYGEPIFYKKMAPGVGYRDFKKQPNGLLTYYDQSAGVYRAMDNAYRFGESYQAGNGYTIDGHGIQVAKNGHILLQIYDEQPVDMSQIVPGGMPTATVIGAVVQELDPSSNVIFEWRSWDHFDITDASDAIDLTTERVDVTHINSVAWDSDGNVLISNRHLDEITKIDRRTAEVIWRMGGKANEFTFTNEDRPFSFQHDARRLPNGNITLYDNGNNADPQYSRAVEYQLDETNKIATKVWEYRNQPEDIYGFATGNAQRLLNGNTVIAWGGVSIGESRPVVTEVRPAGGKAFEMFFVNNESSYRVFRQAWEGRPAEPPTLIVGTRNPTTTLYYSWNGATEIEAYQVYGGSTTSPGDLIDSQIKTSFETTSELPNSSAGPCYFYRVMPIDREGQETVYSNLVFSGDESCELVATVIPSAAVTKIFTSTQVESPSAVTVHAPVGAVSETVTLIYTDLVSPTQSLPNGSVFANTAFAINAYRGGNPQAHFTFNTPITIQVNYPNEAVVGLDENTMEIFYWDPDQQIWTADGLAITQQDKVNNRLIFTSTHLTQFAVFAQMQPLDERNLIDDGSFEGGPTSSNWMQGSTNLPSVICDGQCSYDGIPQSHSGDHWVFFGGGLSQKEEAYIRQEITLPSGQVMTATLTFWFRIAASSHTGDDTFALRLDQNNLFTATDTEMASYQHYTPVSIDVTTNVTQTHILSFESVVQAGHATSFYLDDVSLVVEGYFDQGSTIYLPLISRWVQTASTNIRTTSTPWDRLSGETTLPDDIPPITVTISTAEAGEGYIFMAPYERRINGTLYSPYLLIVDDSGELVYHEKLPSAAEDFKKQPSGLLSHAGGGVWFTHQLMNAGYDMVDTVTAANGYRADFHDFQILPDGQMLLLIYEERQTDMSQIVPGGDPNATVVGCRIQELDSTKNTVFEWSSFDHFAITDTTVSLLNSRIDYVHCNAIERDMDGHLLLSSRDMDEVTKISRDSGDIIWRLGGKNNEFAFVNAIGADDLEFIKQHDIRRAANGNITLFDNRLGVANYSRAVEYQLDEDNKIATLVWEYRNTPDIHGHIMGNAQRLPNGNTLIGWGSGHPAVTEVKRDGSKVYELFLPLDMQNYRAFRFPWAGRPNTEPTLIVNTENPTITLTYSWNGATDVSAYRVYGDKSNLPIRLITIQPKTGFETRTVITTMLDGPYNFRVVPLDQHGVPMIDDPAKFVFLPAVLKD